MEVVKTYMNKVKFNFRIRSAHFLEIFVSPERGFFVFNLLQHIGQFNLIK